MSQDAVSAQYLEEFASHIGLKVDDLPVSQFHVLRVRARQNEQTMFENLLSGEQSGDAKNFRLFAAHDVALAARAR